MPDERTRQIASGPRDPGGASPAVSTPNPLARQLTVSDLGGVPAVPGYTVRRLLGRGGMGAVYEADQRDPPRRVALKLIGDRGLGPAAAARFAIERQAVARLDHPHVARVYDAGVTADGTPFFAMELVAGPPLTEYCDEHRLGVRERLALFVQICSAVQHAHQKGVIHRDLKPANILVAEADGRPVPKVIDFGVAKLATETGGAGVTVAGCVMGTPLYMAPEQANPLAHVDTRADVYSLGVILFELLVGRTPLDPVELSSLTSDEVLRRVCDQTPPRPSTVVRSPGAEAVRPFDPAGWAAAVRGELDWVAHKCLQPDPADRYQSADLLADDVSRYLRDEPVAAHPPSRWYAARKFVRRHRGPVAAAVAMLALLAGGVVGTTLGLIEARRQQRLAIENERRAVANEQAARAEKAHADRSAEAERHANEQTQKRLAQLKKSTNILAQVFGKLNPHAMPNDRPLQVALGDHLVEAAQQLDGEAIGDPLDVADMQLTLAAALTGLSHHQSARPLFEKAHRTYGREFGPDSRQALEAEHYIAESLRLNREVDRATQAHEAVLRRRRAAFGDDDRDTLKSMNALAICYRAAGKTHLAFPLYEHAHRVHLASRGPDHADTISVENNLAVAYCMTGQRSRALPLFERVVNARRETLGADHPETLFAANNLGDCYRRLGDTGRAVETLEQVRQLARARLGATAPFVVGVEYNLALCHLDSGKYDLAVAGLLDVHRVRKASLGASDPDTLEVLDDLAVSQFRAGQPAAAIASVDELMTHKRKQLTPDDPKLHTALARAAVKMMQAKEYPTAERYLRECHTLRETHQPSHWLAAHTRSLLGQALQSQRKYAEAEPHLAAGYAGLKAQAGDIPAPVRRLRVEEALDRLIRLARATGREAEAANWEAERATLPTEHLPPPRPTAGD
jgi:serine/threonine protein kinase